VAEVSLAGWENFYVLTGSAAAGLTGLTFVVIALSADAGRAKMSGLRTFVTPTIVHFGAVVALAAFMSMPGQHQLSLSLGFGVEGFAGLVYVVSIAVGIARIGGSYVPVGEDWIWNAILPAAVYCALLAGALLVWQHPTFSLYVAAGVSVLLTVIGIHNAWDVAVWNTVRRHKDSGSN
jgi:hypothetical protein